jgi:phosphate transport system substrate-binding protein
MISRRSSVLAFTLVVAALWGCDTSKPAGAEATGSAKGSAKGTIRVSGSSALQPLVNAGKEKFEASNPGVSVEVSAGGSKKGLADVASGAVEIGDSDIFAPDDLQAKLVDHKVAVVGFAAMANKGAYNAKVTALSKEDLAKVFTGGITDWKELGGESQRIVVINRAPASGTRTVFGNAVLGGDKFIESQTEDNSGALVAKLKQTTGAISYLATSFQDPDLVTLSLKVDGADVAPTADNITAGKYPVWAYEHMYTQGPPAGPTKSFIDYLLSDDFQKKVLPEVKGFIPVVNMKVTKDKD